MLYFVAECLVVCSGVAFAAYHVYKATSRGLAVWQVEPLIVFAGLFAFQAIVGPVIVKSIQPLTWWVMGTGFVIALLALTGRLRHRSRNAIECLSFMLLLVSLWLQASGIEG